MTLKPTPVVDELTRRIGPGVPVEDSETPEIQRVWTVAHIELALASPVQERRLRALWIRREGKRSTPLLLLTEAGDDVVRVLGPQRPDEPVREVTLDALVTTLEGFEGKPRRDSVAGLVAALERLDRSGIPGVIVRGLLTKHVLRRRLPRDQGRWDRLRAAAAKLKGGAGWRVNLVALGYEVEPREARGHLLRSSGRPVAVVHPFADPAAFSRMTPEGASPEGALVADCQSEGVAWGVLATDSRFRLFPAETPIGAATARYLEMDLTVTSPDDWPYLGLLAPESLAPGGLLDHLINEAVRLGNELRDDVERRIRDEVLPAIARGLGRHSASSGHDLAKPHNRELIEQASLLLLFRLLFLLYLEGRGYLPLSSPSYGPHSATQLLRDARSQASGFSERGQTLWKRFETLVAAMRDGDPAWGLPAYNGDLFDQAALGPSAELLEEARLIDSAFGPALAALGSDPEGEEAEAGVDYGDLEISHLGLIYEGLLSLRLSLATEPMAYDERAERWVPGGRKAEVERGQLFYQSESGGRKAAGVYYTPQVIVRHLVNQAVLPALEAHLQTVAETAKRNANEAAARLFDFRVLDPAMGSAHFLVDALDRMADWIGTFLAEHPLRPVSRLLEDLREEARWEGTIEDGDLLRRLIVKRCIYGVDLSGMAVEMAKVSLWLASFVPGLSLAYLGHNLKRGDSLVGVASQRVLAADLGPYLAGYSEAPIPRAIERAREEAKKIAEVPDRTPEEVDASRAADQSLAATTAGLDQLFDVWTAEPFGLKGARSWLLGADVDAVVDGKSVKGGPEFLGSAADIADARSFFHWTLEFPEVFSRENPGFDAVIGNPPWEELTVEELAFYTLHDPGIRGLKQDADRRKRIDALKRRYPDVERELEARKAELEEKRRFFGPRGGYVIQGAGDKDTYKLFCERYGSLVREGGWIGVVLPRSAFLVDGARGFRRWLFRETEVRRLDLLLNNRSWAFPIHPQYTIALLAGRRAEPKKDSRIHLTGPSASRETFDAASVSDGIPMPRENLGRWTRLDGDPGFEVPLLPSSEALTVFDKVRGGPWFGEGYRGVWSAFPVREFDETNDKRSFRYKEGVPVWKGRSFDQYDPHGRDPAGYAKEREALEKLQKKRTSTRSAFRRSFPPAVLADPKAHPFYSARVAFRDVSRATDSRTVRACLVPPATFLTNKAPYLMFSKGSSADQAFVLGVFNSLSFDWQARRLVETAMNFFILNMLCFPPSEATDMEGIAARAARLSCIDERFSDFAAACGVEAGPLEPEERDRLRAEIDAMVARAYGLSEDDLKVLLTDFTQNAVPDQYRDLVRESFAGA